METKHTPGPWEAISNLVRTCRAPDGNGGFLIAECPPSIGDRLENARLIAAAPELLEAAIELKDVCNRPSAARTRAEAWRKLDKAIAKALQPNDKSKRLAFGQSA